MAGEATPFGIIARATVGSAGNAVSFAFGLAVAPLLAPVLEEIKHKAWEEHASKLPGVGGLIEGVASGQIDEATAKAWAKKEGYDTGPWDAMLAAARVGLPLGAAVDARRRGVDLPGGLHEVYTRHAIEEAWWPALDALVPELLEPSQLAAAIHRGLIPDPGLLKGEQPSGPFKVEAYPVYPVDAVKEAAGSGYDEARLGVLVGLQGLPMGTHEAAQALFRGIITHGDYVRAFNESNSRNEWAAAVLDQSRQIPTARDFLENALRGYRDLGAAIAGAQLHGMSAEHATMIYQNQGRPMALRQITQALSRGGKFKPEPGELTDPYEAAIVEGSLKPAYYDLAKSLRYTLPSAFAMRQLAASGVWSEAKTAQRLKDSGWLPEDADEVAKAWAGSGSTGDGGKWADKARLQLWGVTHSEYLDESIDKAAAAVSFGIIGIPADEHAAIFAAWDHELAISRLELTPAQIKKAYKKALYTEAQALDALATHHMTPADARTFLQE